MTGIRQSGNTKIENTGRETTDNGNTNKVISDIKGVPKKLTKGRVQKKN